MIFEEMHSNFMSTYCISMKFREVSLAALLNPRCPLQLFDRDRDGILTIKELQMLLRCLGLKPDLDQVDNNRA